MRTHDERMCTRTPLYVEDNDLKENEEKEIQCNNFYKQK